MAKHIYNFIWAALTALVTVLTLSWLNGKIGIANWLFFPSVVDFIHSFGWSVKNILFFVLFMLYWINSWHKVVTRFILFFVKCGIRIVLTILAICGIALGVYLGWHFILWLASFL